MVKLNKKNVHEISVKENTGIDKLIKIPIPSLNFDNSNLTNKKLNNARNDTVKIKNPSAMNKNNMEKRINIIFL